MHSGVIKNNPMLEVVLLHEQKNMRNWAVRQREVALNAFVAGGMHVGGRHLNSTVWFGHFLLIALKAFHRRKFLRRLIFDVNISSDCARYAVCADWKDGGNWAVSLQAQEVEASR
jgi:hypothetical protein